MTEDYIYPPILTPIFVFGSNQAGRHGKGAALYARQHFGAKQGQAEGFQGRSYAIPTRTAQFQNLTLQEIQRGLKRFRHFANTNRGMSFVMTPIGCGLAGYTRKEIWPIVASLQMPPNVYLTPSWMDPDDQSS